MATDRRSRPHDPQQAQCEPHRTDPEVATDDLDAATARNTDAIDELLRALGTMLEHLTSTEDTK